MTRSFWIMMLAAGVGGLTACATSHEDLQQWMAEQRRQTVPKVTPLTEPTRYVPLAYVGGTAADAFGSDRLTQVLRRETGPLSVSASLVAPELNRRKEPLEAFPLDALDMVGSIAKGGGLVALVMAPDKVTYRVRPGVYMGQSDGRVTGVFEDRIELIELVPDGAGGWLERPASIALEDQ